MRRLRLTLTLLAMLAGATHMGAQGVPAGYSAGPGDTPGEAVVTTRDARPAILHAVEKSTPRSTFHRAQDSADAPPDPDVIFAGGGERRTSKPSIANPAPGEGTQVSATGDRAEPARLALTAPKARRASNRPSRAKWLEFQANKPISTVLTGLSIVVGIFLLLAWAVRKRMPRGAAKLPDEIIEVLGRTTLAAKQSLHLVRVGGKLIVVSVTAAGTETLTEITDSTEVARILAACQQHQTHSSTAAFRQVFEQFGRERAVGFLETQANGPTYSRSGGRIA